MKADLRPTKGDSLFQDFSGPNVGATKNYYFETSRTIALKLNQHGLNYVHFFINFRAHKLKKKYRSTVRSILMPPNFSWLPHKFTWCQRYGMVFASSTRIYERLPLVVSHKYIEHNFVASPTEDKKDGI